MLFRPTWTSSIHPKILQLLPNVLFTMLLPATKNSLLSAHAIVEYLSIWMKFPHLEGGCCIAYNTYILSVLHVCKYVLTTYHSTLDQSPAMPRPFYNCSFQRLLPSPRRSLQGSRLLFHNDIQVIYFLLAAVAFVTDYLLGPLIIIIIEIIIMFIIIILQCYSFNVKGYSNCY